MSGKHSNGQGHDKSEPSYAGYDETSIQSIVEYAQNIVGHTLRDSTGATTLQDPKKRRGSFGNAVEEYYFHYKPNNDPGPDFPDAGERGLELKTTPMKKVRRNQLVAKERLVLKKIDYHSIVKESFEHSRLMQKAGEILLISYLWEKDKDPLDYKVLFAEVWQIPSEDLPQIKRDWQTVVDKVKSGHAEEISGSDTMYLEACTKAANSRDRTTQPFSTAPAKPRAWALKASYMTAIENALLNRKRQRIERAAKDSELSLLELVRSRFRPYRGFTVDELKSRFGLSKSKNVCARITKKILGVDDDAQIDEFVKAGIEPKTIRLQASGRPKEAMSFRAFDYFELEATDFYDSKFYGYLQQKWLFVIFREGSDKEYRLWNVMFWQMPESDIPEAKRCYDQMRENVRQGRADRSVKSSENRCCHVRPHGRNSDDTNPQPHGNPVTKKSFWLNQSYLQEVIRRELGDGKDFETE